MPQPRRRNKRLPNGEKYPITRAAKDMAGEINELRAQLMESQRELDLVDKDKREKLKRQRKAKSDAAARRARAARRKNGGEKVYCKGTNLVGKPCRLPPLIPGNWDGANEVTGEYCLHHDANVTTEERIAFQQAGSARVKAHRRISPIEVAYELTQRAPYHMLRPYLKGLGLELDEDTGQLRRIGTGLKLYGYSRGGQVVKSQYPDYVGQVNMVEKLLDRIYGKARQSMDLASVSHTTSININMDVERVGKVASVLADAGILNGNGHHELPEVIDGTAEE